MDTQTQTVYRAGARIGSVTRQIDYLVSGIWEYNPELPFLKNTFTGNIYQAAGLTDPRLWMESDIIRSRGIMVDSIDGVIAISSKISAPPPYETSHTEVRKHMYGSELKLAHAVGRLLTCHSAKVESKCFFEALFLASWGENIDIFQWELFSHYNFRIFKDDCTPKLKTWLETAGSLLLCGSTLKERASDTLEALGGRSVDLYSSLGKKKTYVRVMVEKVWNKLRELGYDLTELDQENLNPALMAFARLVIAVERELAKEKSLISTSKGYIGWAYTQVRRGDHICILSGCSVPVILRSREDGGFYVLGDAFVEGIMDGELVRTWARRTGLSWKFIED